MQKDNILIGTLLDEACLTLEELASACAVNSQWVVRHVEQGLLEPSGASGEEWRFSSACLRRVQRMRVIERDFDAAPELAALVADLFEELDALRNRLRGAGVD